MNVNSISKTVYTSKKTGCISITKKIS